jgi:uncharacterized protein YciI
MRGMPWPRFSDLQPVTLLFLRKGPNWTSEASDAAELQVEHLAFLKSLREAGHIAIVGPFLDGGDLRSACVYLVPIDEALSLAGKDPAVLAGHLQIEAHPWMVEKSAVAFHAPDP